MPKSKQTFEENISQLEEIIASLEKGDVPLETSIKLFETGVKLSGDCMQLLTAAEQKIKLLTEQPDGAVTELDFIPKDE